MTKNVETSSFRSDTWTWKTRRVRYDSGTSYVPTDKDGKDVAITFTDIFVIILAAAETSIPL